MTHPREDIRKAVAAALTFKTSARERVFATREVPWKKLELPGIAVYTLSEKAADSEWSRPRRPSLRDVQLAVVGVVSVTDQIDDELDSLAAEIEAAVGADMMLGGKAAAARYSGSEIQITEEQGRPMGAVRLTYEFRYLSQKEN